LTYIKEKSSVKHKLHFFPNGYKFRIESINPSSGTEEIKEQIKFSYMSNIWHLHFFLWDPTLQNFPCKKIVTVINKKVWLNNYLKNYQYTCKYVKRTI
jgi:hypothetical protein